MCDQNLPALRDTWPYKTEYPFSWAATIEFSSGTPGYHRCVAVAKALRDGGYPMPEDDMDAAQAVVFMLRQVSREKQ